MAFIADVVFDTGLDYVTTNADRIDVCSQEPTTYTEATSTYSLGSKSGLSIGAAQDGAISGRRVVTPAITDGSISSAGTVTHWGLTGNSELLATESITPTNAVVSGELFALGAMSVWIDDATIGEHSLTADDVESASEVTTPVLAETSLRSYIGIPAPTYSNAALVLLGYSAWDYEPRDYPVPDRPSPWTSNQTGFYYVTETGTNSGNGYPGDPSGSIPTNPPAGALVVVEGHLEYTGDLGLTWTNGTSSDPTFLVGNTDRDTDRISFSSGALGLGGDHMFLDGLTVNRRGGTPSDNVFAVDSTADQICVRHCTFDNLAGFRSGFGALTSIGASTTRIMFYQNNIGPGGDWDEGSLGDNDYHGIKGFGTNIWILENYFYRNQGDGIQINNEGGGADPDDAQLYWVAGNTGLENHQTMCWTKDAIDVVFSENESVDNFDGNNSSTNSAFGCQGDYSHCWFIANKSELNGEGVKAAGSDGGNNVYIIGNEIKDQDPSNTADSGGFNNWAISVRNSGDQYILLNTIHNVQAGIACISGAGTPDDVVGNFIDDPTNGSRQHILVGTSGTNVNYNYFRGSSARVSGFSTDGNDTISDTPGMVDEANDDFRPDTGSNMLDAIPDTALDTALDFYETRYGIDIRKDILGTVRPQNTDHDFGAYEKS